MRKLALFSLFALLLVSPGCNSTKPILVTVTSPTGAQALDIGQTFNISVTVSQDKTNKGVMFKLTGVGSLTNVTTTGATYAAGNISGTATVTITSVADPTKMTTINIVVTAAPSITSASPLTAATEGTAYSGTIAVTGGAGALTYSVTVGSLPAGLNLNSSTGAITGTATGPGGTFTFTVQVKDSSTVAPQSNSKSFTITINLPPPPSITTTSPLPAGQVGAAYNKTIAVTGLSPFTFSITSGSLPAGLGLNPSTGAISGTPTAYGPSSFTVKVVDSSNPTQSTSQPFTLTIAPAPVVITTTSLPNVVANTAYSASLLATGGATPITWSVIAGALPAGVNLAANGTFSGTPTTAGTANFTVQAADTSTPALTATKALSIIVIPVLSITTASPLVNGVASTAYSTTLASTGGSGTVTWSVTAGSLPAGLTLNGNTGAITGTPTTAGTYGFTVQAADSGTPQQKVTKAFALTINPQLIITTTALPTGAVTSTYSATLVSSGGVPAITWAIIAGALPGGLNLTPGTGAITGTPTASGTFPFTAQATDSGTPQQVVTKQLNITINPVLSITQTSPMTSGTVGTAYSQSVLNNGGGIPPLTWSIIAGALPTGLGIGPTTGAITGTPTATGTFSFTVQAADSGTPQQIASKALSISIATAPLSITNTLPNGVVGQAYNATLTSAGGNPPVTWSISSGSLPTWATLNPTTGAITGTPTATGTTSFTVKATDSTVPTAETATKLLSITVNTALTITSTTLPGGMTGTAYNGALTATGGVTPYTWAVISGSFPSWANLNASTGAITGTPDAGGTSTFTVQVTDNSSPRQTATQLLTITVTVPTLTVTTTSGSLPAGTVNTAYTSTQLNASGGIPSYTWLVVSPGTGPLPTGLALSTSGQITGTPTATGTFPFTVQVTDSATPANTATANLSITINAVSTSTCDTTLTGKESLLKGDYAFVLSGFDSSQNPAFVGGVFVAGGVAGAGNITAGTLDMNLASGVVTNTLTSTSTYNLGQDSTGGYRGCMTFVTTSAGTQHYAFSVDSLGGTPSSASDGHMIDFDTTGPFTMGILRQATSSAFSTSAITGTWAFGVSGPISASSGGGKFAAAGLLTFSSGTVSGVADVNDDGYTDNSGVTKTPYPTAAAGVTLGGGSYSVGSNGRGTLDFTPSGGSLVTNFLYVVSSTEALVMNSDSQSAGNNGFIGRALKQSGTFTTAAFTGSFVEYNSGWVTSATSLSQIGLVSASGTHGTFTYSGYANSGGLIADAASDPTDLNITGTFSVAPNGRLTTTVSHGQAPVFYLVNANLGFYLGGDTAIGSGYIESQTGSPFGNTSASGLYGHGGINPEVFGVTDESGDVTFTSSTTSISGTSDKNAQGTLVPDGAVTGTYAIDSTGVGLIPTGCTLTGASANCSQLFVVISPTKAVTMKVKQPTDTTPKITILQQ